MQMPRLLIADGAEELRQELSELFASRCQVKTCADGEHALQLLQDFCPDILVVDLLLPKMDGITLLQRLYSVGHKPAVLAMTALPSPYVMEALQRLEVDYVMMKPCDLTAMEARLSDFISQLQDLPIQRQDNRNILLETLMQLSFVPKLDGFGYLLSAVPMYADDPSQAITKELYVTVGAPFGKSPRLVERSIRNAIEKAWQQGDMQIWRQYFRAAPDGTVPRPSNGAFIARMAQLLVSFGTQVHSA